MANHPTNNNETAAADSTAPAAASQSVNRWGVQLKKTRTQRGGNGPKEDRAAKLVQNQRASLRHVNLPPRQRRRSSSNSMKRRSSASSCSSLGWKTRKANGSAFLGVALKPFPLKTIQEDEETEFFDLKLLGESSSSLQSCSGSACSSSGRDIAVRQKPKTRRNNKRRSSGGAGTQNKVYQIDLDPAGSRRGKGGKSFLEVKARSVKKEVPEDNPVLDKVELELRHVVDPKDGRPRQVVTEAIFQVPLSKAVRPLRRGETEEEEAPPEPELLQISIQNLQQDSVQLVLKQVDPDTREVFDMQNLIDIQLREPEGMKVQLQKIPTTTDRWGNSACKDAPCSRQRSTIDLTQVRSDLGNDDEYEEDQESSDLHESEDYNSSIHITLKDCMSRLEMSSLTVQLEDGDWWEEQPDAPFPKPPPTRRSSSPAKKIDVGLNVPRRTQDADEAPPRCKVHPSSDSCNAKVCDQNPTMPKRSSHTALTLDESSSTRGKMPFPTAELIDDDSDDDSSISSSSSDEDSDSESDEDELELVEIVPPPPPPPSPPAKEETTTTTKPISRDLITLYNRMGCPTKQQMKERLLKMHGADGISPEDVELLPWLAGGRFLNYRAMNQMCQS